MDNRPLTVRELKKVLEGVDDDSIVTLRYKTPGNDIPFRDVSHHAAVETDPGRLGLYSETYGFAVKGILVIDGGWVNRGKRADGEGDQRYSS